MLEYYRNKIDIDIDSYDEWDEGYIFYLWGVAVFSISEPKDVDRYDPIKDEVYTTFGWEKTITYYEVQPKFPFYRKVGKLTKSVF